MQVILFSMQSEVFGKVTVVAKIKETIFYKLLAHVHALSRC